MRIFILKTLLVLTAVSALSSPAFARREVESAEKLAFLNQATGASDNGSVSGSSSSFQTRFDAIMDVDAPTIERELIATQDEYRREEAAFEEKIEAEEDLRRTQELNPNRYDPLKARDNFKLQDPSSAPPKVNAGEQAFQKERDDIQKEFDERIQKKTAVAPQAAASPASEAASNLANNPFYKGTQFQESENRFEERKAVIRSRLIQSGYTEETAYQLTNSAANEEDVIRGLMRDNDISYGDASDIVS